MNREVQADTSEVLVYMELFFGKFRKFRLEKLPQIIQWILYSMNTTLQTTNHLANQVISSVHRQLQKKSNKRFIATSETLEVIKTFLFKTLSKL